MSGIEELRLFAAGSCWQKEAFSIRGGKWRDVEFPATCTVFRHPEVGWILYDTGYDPEIASGAQELFMRWYARFMKVVSNSETSVLNRLRELGIGPDNIALVVLSHFHPDHIGGARFFSKARFLCSRNGYEEACRRPRRLGFHRELLPADFESRCEFVEDKPVVAYEALSSLGTVYDLLGDGSVLSVLIDGHAPRQVACLVAGQARSCFLVADAAWSRQAILQRRPPHRLTRLIQDDWNALCENLSALHRISLEQAHWVFLPSHCRTSLREGMYRLAGNDE